MHIDSADLLERFLRYVQIDTRSDGHNESTPSTPVQWTLLRLLADELRQLGARDVQVLEKGYVIATIPATSSKAGMPTMAWFAHVDTATNLPSAAKPLVHRHYAGQVITLPDDPSQVLDPEKIPELKSLVGNDLITASGLSLLGADDKAGVAIIMATARHLLAHPEIQHGDIRVVFNPDEEIGRGVTQLPLETVKADFAFTLDGDNPGELNYETFSADGASIQIQGVASHPGAAKDVMVNALRIAGRILAALPVGRSPENTELREGFIHPVECNGNAEEASIAFILRDFELEGLEGHRQVLRSIVEQIAASEPRAQIKLSFREQYRNMRYWLEKDMRAVHLASEAYRRAGFKEVRYIPIRGGTDGSNLTARGLPCPNLFTGMHEIHSQREFVSLQDMEKSASMLLHLAQLSAE